jgi:hypothetical protein
MGEFKLIDAQINKYLLNKCFFNVFLVCPTWLIFFIVYVIASIAYINPVYSDGVRTRDPLIMSPLPLPLDHGSCLMLDKCLNYQMFRLT